MAWTKRNIGRIFCTGLYFFFSGVEYVVILPTLNGYLNSLGAPAGFLGILMASFSFSGLVSTPIYGHLSDKSKSSKFALIASNVFEIVGNLLYFTGRSVYVLWASRFVAGIGSGSGSAILAMISRTTRTSERTSVFSIVMSMRQIGLVIGPAANLLFQNLHASIGPFRINEFTAPGLFMAVIWLFHTVLTIFMYFDEAEPNDDNSIADDVTAGTSRPTVPTFWRRFLGEFIREEVVLCIASTFILTFVQVGLEAILTPMTFLFFGWGGLYNSYMYCALGVAVITSFAVLTASSRFCRDRNLALFGISIMLMGAIVFLVYTMALLLPKYSTNRMETPNWLLAVFALDCALFIIGIPFAWVPMASLFTKVTSTESQGFDQGIRLSVLGLGQILGPTWAAPMATFARLPYAAGVNLFLMTLLICMVLASYKNLTTPDQPIMVNSGREDFTEDETTPLVHGSHWDDNGLPQVPA